LQLHAFEEDPKPLEAGIEKAGSKTPQRWTLSFAFEKEEQAISV